MHISYVVIIFALNKVTIMDITTDRTFVEGIFRLLSSLHLSHESWMWLSEKTTEQAQNAQSETPNIDFSTCHKLKRNQNLPLEERQKIFRSLYGAWKNDPEADMIDNSIRNLRNGNNGNTRLISTINE